MKIQSVILLLFSTITVSMAQPSTDSILNVMKSSPPDTNKVNQYLELASFFKYSEPDSALYYLEEGVILAQNINFREGEARLHLLQGETYVIKGVFSKSIASYEKALAIFKELKNENQIGETLNSIGRVYEKKGDYEKAISNYIQSLKIREKLNDKKGIASSLNSIGVIYLATDDTMNARISFEKAFKLISEVNNKNGIAMVLNNLGLVYDKMGKNDTALTYFNRSLAILEEIGNTSTISMIITNIGNQYLKKEDYNKALEFYKKSLTIKEQVGDITGIINVYINMGDVYQKQNKIAEAINQINKALTLAKEIRFLEGIKNCYNILRDLYEATGNWKEAYDAIYNFSLYRDTLINENNSKVLLQLREEYEADKREKEIALQKAENEQNQAIIEQQTTQIYAFTIGIILLLVLAVVILNGYRQKRKANKLLEAQNIEISKQKALIEEKNNDIMASITYAQRIQQAILPPAKLVRQSMPNSFILFKPKDIVSGDFYWVDFKQPYSFFSVVDCTGHGVPGAFMSIVGHNGLNQAVNEYKLVHPGEILDKLNDLVEKTLHKSEDSNVKDGMDIALCTLDLSKNLLEFAGANNPMYLVRPKGRSFELNGEIQKVSVETDAWCLYEIKANKQPIGAYVNRVPFTTHCIQLQNDDSIYIFSDGYPDQFGGPDGKKFKYKPFKELLLKIQIESMQEQSRILDEFMTEWRGEHEQIDDICVIGLRV